MKLFFQLIENSEIGSQVPRASCDVFMLLFCLLRVQNPLIISVLVNVRDKEQQQILLFEKMEQLFSIIGGKITKKINQA